MPTLGELFDAIQHRRGVFVHYETWFGVLARGARSLICRCDPHPPVSRRQLMNARQAGCRRPRGLHSRADHASAACGATETTLEVELAGSWRGAELPAIDAELAASLLRRARASLRVQIRRVAVDLDLAGPGACASGSRPRKSRARRCSSRATSPASSSSSTRRSRARVAPLRRRRRNPTFEPVSALGRHGDAPLGRFKRARSISSGTPP